MKFGGPCAQILDDRQAAREEVRIRLPALPIGSGGGQHLHAGEGAEPFCGDIPGSLQKLPGRLQRIGPAVAVTGQKGLEHGHRGAPILVVEHNAAGNGSQGGEIGVLRQVHADGKVRVAAFFHPSVEFQNGLFVEDHRTVALFHPDGAHHDPGTFDRAGLVEGAVGKGLEGRASNSGKTPAVGHGVKQGTAGNAVGQTVEEDPRGSRCLE